MACPDRRTALCEQNPPRVTGIDFVQVVDPADQTLLRVFFLIDPDILDDPLVATADLPAPAAPGLVTLISISGGERLAEAAVLGTTWTQVTVAGQTRTVLEVQTREAGDFSRYRLTVHDPLGRIDRFFNGVEFSFKQGCPDGLDCKPVFGCPPPELVDFPVDYLARDFVSLRNALLDFAAHRYPRWQERIEADVGVMLAEVMAALGDELAYIQDRHAREAYLETATERRSLRWHTRLVDYPIHDGLAASTLLDVQVAAGGGFVAAGARVWARPQAHAPIPFEIGERLADQRAGRQFWTHGDWNRMPAHLPDAASPCLPVGATELFLRGHLPDAGQLPEPEPGADPVPVEAFWLGRTLVFRTDPADPSLPRRRHRIEISELEHTEDPLCLEQGLPMPITRIRWSEAQALPFELNLAETVAAGNILPAVAGETFTELLVIGANEDLPPGTRISAVVERQGPHNELAAARSPVFRHTLRDSEALGLGWTGALPEAAPEVELQQVQPASLDPTVPPRFWDYRRSLLDSRGFEDHFTLDDGSWRRVIGFRRFGEVIEHRDYANGAGLSLRFGDGEFGRLPAEGSMFRVRYRSGPGSDANLPADSVTVLANPDPDAPPGPTLVGFASAVSNPFAVTSGLDPEAAETIRQLAPEAFRALTLRAVRDEDYREIAERLPWVQRAGARARWTGSWLSEFVTPDPLGAFFLSGERREELENLMDCVRQTGREVHVRDPVYLNIDLEIDLCLAPAAYAGQVVARVVRALTGPGGFFDPDHFSFGTALYRPALEAVVQAVPGVRAVETIRIRVRGVSDWRVFTEHTFVVSTGRIIRLQNDPRFPERGLLRVRPRGEVEA